MSLKAKRIIFFAIWFILVLSPLVTVFKSTSIAGIFSDPLKLVNVFQRLTGMLAFILLFIQISLGFNMNVWVQIIGAGAFKLHTIQGLIAYTLIFIHPLFENVIVYQLTGKFTDALLVFLPKFATQRDILLVYGRVGFWLATISVTAAYFRTKPFFRRNWRALHILNYLIFFLIFFHSKLGTDVNTPPFSWIRWGALVLVVLILAFRVYPLIVKRKIFFTQSV